MTLLYQWATFGLMVIAGVCLVTAAIDALMNGSEYAEWAPYGFSIGAVAVLCLWVMP